MRLVRIKGKINGAMYRENLDDNILQSAMNVGLEQSFRLEKDNDCEFLDPAIVQP